MTLPEPKAHGCTTKQGHGALCQLSPSALKTYCTGTGGQQGEGRGFRYGSRISGDDRRIGRGFGCVIVQGSRALVGGGDVNASPAEVEGTPANVPLQADVLTSSNKVIK